MPNEIKTILPEEEKTSFRLPVLTVDKDDILPTEKQDQEAAWHELKNAYITKRILSGNLIGMETTPNDNRVVGVTYFQDYKIIIPAQELIALTPNARNSDTAEVRQQKIISSMIGAEISYMIIALDNVTQTVVASRLRANERNRQTFFFDKDDKGRYKIYEDSLVEARIIGLGTSTLHVEIFGAECGIPTREISWDWITDVSERFSVGDRVMVRITEIKGRENGEAFSISASVRLAQASKQAELLKTVSKGNLYTGQVMDIRKGTYLIKLSNGVNALAHSNYSRKNILKNDIVAFVVNRVDSKTVMATGNIIRLIRSGRRS